MTTQPTKTIALYGGSFNPAHSGHFTVMDCIQKQCHFDEIWMEFSLNLLKDTTQAANLSDRFNMAAILHKNNFAALPVKYTHIGEDIGSQITADVLDHLRKTHPDTEFVWIMGSDALLSFDRWINADHLMQNYKFIVLPRDGYDLQNAINPIPFADQQIDLSAISTGGKTGWAILPCASPDISSSFYRAAIANGQTNFTPDFQPVADYIKRNDLYTAQP